MNNLKFNLAKETFEEGTLDSSAYILTVDNTVGEGNLFTNDSNDIRYNLSDVEYMLIFISTMINQDIVADDAFGLLMEKELRLQRYQFLENRHLVTLNHMAEALESITRMFEGSCFASYGATLLELIRLQIKIEFVLPVTAYLRNIMYIDSTYRVRKQLFLTKITSLYSTESPTAIDKKKLTELYRELCVACGMLPLFGECNSLVLRTNGFINQNMSIEQYKKLCQHILNILPQVEFNLERYNTTLSEEDLEKIYVISSFLTRTEIHLNKRYNDVVFEFNEEIDRTARGEFDILAMFKTCIRICIENNYSPMMVASYMNMLSNDASAHITSCLNSTLEHPISPLYVLYANRILNALTASNEILSKINPILLYNLESADGAEKVYLVHKYVLDSSINADSEIYCQSDYVATELLRELLSSEELENNPLNNCIDLDTAIIEKKGLAEIDKELRKLMC